MALDEDWDIQIYEPPEANWPFVVVTMSNKLKATDAQFAGDRKAAELLRRQIHERLWRAKYKFGDL